MRNRYLYITLLTLLGLNAEAQTVAQAPRLVVTIAIDQLRTDYLETFAPLYSPDGFRRLLAEGLVYPNASYNFTPVDRTSAVASLVTGATPYYNSITGAEWLDRSTLRPRHLLGDKEHDYAPTPLATSTLSDELKIATGGEAKVFAFATDADRAILTAGHAADGAVWMEQGRWRMARYYMPANQWLEWYTRQYQPAPGADINQCVTTIALRCAEQSGIGNDDNTDLLSVTYTAQPSVEGYLSLDLNIAELIKGVTARIPLDRVLFVLTSTGSSEEEEENQEENERFHIPTGKFYINRTANLLNMYLGAIYGSAQYVETSYRNQLFLNHKLIDRKNLNMGEVLQRAQEFMLQLSGVRNVYTSHQLLTSDSHRLERIRNGYSVERSGDLQIEIQPGWEYVDEDTHTSTTSRVSYIPFPIIFYGAGTKAERIQTPVTADRIAPTVARAIRIRAPNACSAEPLF